MDYSNIKDQQTIKALNDITEVTRKILDEQKKVQDFFSVLKGDPGKDGKAGEPGKDGKTPKKGVDYFTQKEVDEFVTDISEIVLSTIKRPKDGKTPKKGVDYFTQEEIKGITKKINKSLQEYLKSEVKEIAQNKINTLSEQLEVAFDNVYKSIDIARDADSIRDALESLTGDQRLDAKAIKNLPSGGGGGAVSTGGGGSSTLSGLTDVTISTPTTGQSLIYNSTTSKWENSTAAGSGDMTKAVYDPNTIESDAFDMDNMVTGTTNKIFTSTDETKLAGIEAGAQVNTVDSVNTQTGAVVLDADDIDDSSTTNKFTTAADISKLAGIEAGAEVNNISDINATDLTDGGDSTLHYHASDRDRANHTGVQAISTITDLQTELDSKVDEVASTDNAIVRFDGTGGSIQDSTPTIDDAGRINNVTDPALAQDAATKAYVDSAVTVGGGNNFNNYYVDQSGGTSDTYGVLAGTIDGSNTTFTVSQGSYVSGGLEVYRNGQLQTQGSSEDWVESVPTSGTFLFNNPPTVGDELTAVYKNTDTINDQNLEDLAGITFSQGDILYYDGANLTNLGAGSDGQVLTLASGNPSWADASGGGGAVELLASGEITTSTSSITMSIATPTGYKSYKLVTRLRSDGNGQLPENITMTLKDNSAGAVLRSITDGQADTGYGSLEFAEEVNRYNDMAVRADCTFMSLGVFEIMAKSEFGETISTDDYYYFNVVYYGGSEYNSSSPIAVNGFASHAASQLNAASYLAEIELTPQFGSNWTQGDYYLYGFK